jgi:hypothetical protein
MKKNLNYLSDIKFLLLLLLLEYHSKIFYLLILDLTKVIYYFLMVDKQSLLLIYCCLPFYLEACFETIILEIVDWSENNLKLASYWVLFIITMSLCVRNEYGHDIETTHYIIFSTAMGYGIYIHKEFYPKDTRFLFFKICTVCVIVVKIFWPILHYTWPFNYVVISPEEFKNLFFFIWPQLNFINPDKYDLSFLASDKYAEAKTVQKEWYYSSL